MENQLNKDSITTILKKYNYTIVSEERLPNDTGYQLKLSNSCIINCFDTGKYSVQGKNIEEIKRILESESVNSKTLNDTDKEIFVVYGHDDTARTQLDAMLRRWDLKPIILDQIESSGLTIIEKLEENISRANFGIVLATPDDVGASKHDREKLRYRVRQNVLLEMGMLLASLKRERVAILLKSTEDMEKPSDIHGLIYIPFKDNVEETKVNLVKELKRNNYDVKIENL